MADNPFIKPITGVNLVTPKQDAKGGMSIVVLERIEPGVTPEYCVHGRVPCYSCQEWCWLGHETYEIVRSGEAAGLCIECATEKLPKEARPSRRVRDHRRADGPH